MGTICSSPTIQHAGKSVSQSSLKPSYHEPVHTSGNHKSTGDESLKFPHKDVGFSNQNNTSSSGEGENQHEHLGNNSSSGMKRTTSGHNRAEAGKEDGSGNDPNVPVVPEVVKLPCLENLPRSIARRVIGRLQEEDDVMSSSAMTSLGTLGASRSGLNLMWQQGTLGDKVVRVYHVAHLTDTHDERDYLQETVYPGIRKMCLERGFDLDIIDLNWGQWDPYVSTQKVGEETRQYLRRLLEIDKNVVVVVFLGEKYGAYGCPQRVAQDDLSIILNRLSDDDRTFINQWYRLDENSIPKHYVLLPITMHFNGYGSFVNEDHQTACDEWERMSHKICDILWNNGDQEFQQLYLRSRFDQEIETNILDDRGPAENVVLVKRTFKSKKPVTKKTTADFIDMKGGVSDKVAQNLLRNLSNRLNDKVESFNKIDVEIPFYSNGAQNRENQEYSKYLKSIASKYKEVVKAAVEKALEAKSCFDRIRVNMIGAGMQKFLYDDIIQHTMACQTFARDVIGQHDVIAQMKSYIVDGHPTGSSQHIRPLVIAGPSGSGKSSMAAILAYRSCAMRGWTKSVCIIRHIGCGPGCQSLDETIASVCVQLCFLFNLPYSYAHKPVSMYPGGFRQLLYRVPETTPLIIILDGVDFLADVGGVEWLPDELPGHVRLVLTATQDTPTYNSLKNLPWQNEGYSVLVPNLDEDSAKCLLSKHISHQGRRLTASQQEQVEAAAVANLNPLYIKLIALITTRWHSFTEKDELLLAPNIKELVRKAILHALEERHGEEPVGRMLTYLSVLQGGIADTEIIDMLSWDEGFLQPIYLHSEPLLRRAPGYLWIDLHSTLGYCLLQVTSPSGLVLTRWRHRILQEVAMEMYKCYESATWIKILDHYEGRWANGKQMRYAAIEKGVEHLKDRLARQQPIKYGDGAYNIRKLDQMCICLAQNDMYRTLKNDYLLNVENLTHMLRALNVYRVMFCMKLYLQMQDEDDRGRDDVRFIYDLLCRNASVVSQGAEHLWSQFTLRVNAGKMDIANYPIVQKLFESISRLVKTGACAPFLIMSDVDIVDTQDNVTCVKPRPMLNGLFSMRGDRNHVISVATDDDAVTVWNIHHQVAVRTLTNLPQPKSLKMIDSARAVVLCNRELRIYNLEEGCEQCRLKGVLNLKMPYYGVVDAEHTVALSRNRMYVNIIKNSTGDMDATFKVGEDRFLDSLIISGSGEWCVCGDVVQKPFPLLVWDLTNRKLVHDMRIAAHEFVTRMAAITHEGHYVVCVCRYAIAPSKRYVIIERAATYTEDDKESLLGEPNFLIVYDLQSGSLFKKWKPMYNTTSVEISSASNLVVSGHEDGSVHVWDLIGGALKHQMTGHNRGPDHISISEDGDRAATCDLTCVDTSVRLWDLVKGECLGSFVTDYGVTCCQISLDGSMVVVGVPGNDTIVCLWADPEDQERSKMDISIYGDASRNKQCFSMTD